MPAGSAAETLLGRIEPEKTHLHSDGFPDRRMRSRRGKGVLRRAT